MGLARRGREEEEEAMQGHRRRRETKRSPATPIRKRYRIYESEHLILCFLLDNDFAREGFDKSLHLRIFRRIELILERFI